MSQLGKLDFEESNWVNSLEGKGMVSLGSLVEGDEKTSYLYGSYFFNSCSTYLYGNLSSRRAVTYVNNEYIVPYFKELIPN